MIEAFMWDKGINRKKSTLFLVDGEAYSCEGFTLETIGILKAREPKTIGELIDADGAD